MSKQYLLVAFPVQIFIAFLCLLVLSNLVPLKKGAWRRLVLMFGCWLLTGMIIFIGDLDNLPPTILVFLVAVYIGCEGTRLQKTTVALMLASTTFAYNALVDNYLPLNTYFFPRLFFWLGLFLLINHFGPPKDYELAPALWRLLLLLTTTPLGIVLSLVLLQNPEDGGTGKAMIVNLVLLTMATLSFIGLLWTVTLLARQRRLEQQEQLYEVTLAHYRQLEQQQFEIRRLRHDLANHLQILLTLSDGEREGYLRELIASPGMQPNRHYCENQVINAVLNAKAGQMEAHQIRLTHSIEVPEGGLMEKSELCALFANVMDNAIEACLKLPQSQREITLKVKADKGLLVCQMSNPIHGPIELKNGLPVTTKEDKHRHGYGLRGVQEILRRHQGKLEVDIEGEVFRLFFYLPFQRIQNEASQPLGILAKDQI